MSDDIASLISLHDLSDSVQAITTLSISSVSSQPPQYNDAAVSRSSSDGGLGAGFACSGEVKSHPYRYFRIISDSHRMGYEEGYHGPIDVLMS